MKTTRGLERELIEQFQIHFDEKQFQEPTAIQQAVAEPLKDGKSVLGIAPTGSGKTLAFTWPVLPNLSERGGVQLVVLEPSQELAMQTTRVLREWARLLHLRVQSLTGGANIRRQILRLREHAEIIVGTPGRILDLANQGRLELKTVRTLIIDEADDLLQDDTEAVVEDIERRIPIDSQLGFFSATWAPVFNQLEDMFGQKIQLCDVRKTDKSRGPVHHYLLRARNNQQKSEVLRKLCRQRDFRALVFINSQRTISYVAARMRHQHVKIAVLGGKERGTRRAQALRMMRKRQIQLLLTTDVAARGLDIVKLPAVINYDLPKAANQYVHRSGRTGRQGEPGTVYNLGDDHDFRRLRQLLKDSDYDLEMLPAVPETKHDLHLDNKGEKDEAAANQQKRQERQAQKQSKKSYGFWSRKPATSVPANPRRHKKNRHHKNKGIRFKRRKQEAAAAQTQQKKNSGR